MHLMGRITGAPNTLAEMAWRHDDHRSLDRNRPCRSSQSGRTRVLWVACGAHALHDGLTDTLYLLLPLWQAQFALSYAAIGILRALYAGAMAGFQVPAAKLAQRIGWSEDARGRHRCRRSCLSVSWSKLERRSCWRSRSFSEGIGSSTQHPIASSLVAAAYEGPRSRGALGTYNFAGDLGKMALPSITACLIAVMSWRSAASAGRHNRAVGRRRHLAVAASGAIGERGAHDLFRPEQGKARERDQAAAQRLSLCC